MTAQPVGSLRSTECPTPGTASSRAFGYCAAVRRASSSGVRRSSRPDRIRTGTFGPAYATGSGRGVGGQVVQSCGNESSSSVRALNGAKPLRARR